MLKKLLPMVVSCAVWGPRLAKLLFQSDNTGVVAAVNGTDALVMHQASGSCLALLLAGSGPNNSQDVEGGQTRYLRFCSDAGLTPAPTSEDTLLMFVGHLAQEGLAYSLVPRPSLTAFFAAVEKSVGKAWKQTSRDVCHRFRHNKGSRVH